MSQKSRAFWGGLLLIFAAVLMVSQKGGVNILPPVTYDRVQFVLLEETSESNPDLAVLVNSSQWQDLASRGVTTVRYDVTPNERQPALDKYLKDKGDKKHPIILIYDPSGKLIGYQEQPRLDTLDGLVKKYTGK